MAARFVPLLPVALCAGLAFGTGVAACAPLRVNGEPVSRTTTTVRLHDHDLTLHLASGIRAHAEGPLLVYATGDAGWWGKDKHIYEVLSEWGYPVAGFSARAYVHHLASGSEVERPVQLADDYVAIIAAAERALVLSPSAGVVLVGKSRGAGLEVAAAATPRLRAALRGVLAVGLTREEEFVERRPRGARRGQPRAMLQTYDVLPLIGRVPVAVIQSTEDDYLPAGEARALFGSDTDVRRFEPIVARNHNFDGAIDQMYQEMADSFAWIIHR